MKKGTKTALICGVIFLAALVGYTGLDPFSYRNDSFYTGKQMKLCSAPEQVTPESLRERRYYRPTDQGLEERFARRLEEIRAWKQAKKNGKERGNA